MHQPWDAIFLNVAVGLLLSDPAADIVAFMHGNHGSDHHLLAFVKSNAPGLHHCSWDVASINDIGLGAMKMADKGYSRGWGLGRHVLGSNYFHYVRDPWGSYSEYSCGPPLRARICVSLRSALPSSVNPP
jgi:Glyoxalase/Bleomycin resistance protein/Dioxygenase superfamily